ncbi:plasmid pRiA4b ORF-3 family protein [Micromonospora polyrhachis]|uniref:Plasmid pRiA4b Orf3-like domain-containing protein n=1 Tax=Micromonospora polyrhachis TaxID=1282883 RepID=A0A7W7WN80_9ACTN|nr:plasmid pRiA4b ORF-3 family protein [Micromonospora polyrhachis]MBB4957916.1 hypothetical protein [Micromonospora polyrhachis]
MSPVSRGRKGQSKKRAQRRSVPLVVVGDPDPCDCPGCSGEEVDREQLLDGLLAGGVELLDTDDPLDAEMVGASFLATVMAAEPDFEEPLVDGLIPSFEARATPEALAMLLAIGSVARDGRVGKAASAAADRLAEAGTPRPAWVAELNEPVMVTDCRRLSDRQGAGAMFSGVFHRADRSLALLMSVDTPDCGAASQILLIGTDDLPEATRMMRDSLERGGLAFEDAELDPAEFRWQVENALVVRAAHDRELGPLNGVDFADDEEVLDYAVLSVLVGARLAQLPASSKPVLPHEECEHDDDAQLAMLRGLVGQAGRLLARGGPRGRRTPALPPKRKKADGPAPIFQIKVGLRDAKPPIWRRLEVPANVTLAKLHDILQIAFAWEHSHMHVFETPYGEFGVPDPDLGHRSAASVKLEQVAPGEKSKISYTYDFGDSWEHEIVVEKVLDRDKATTYPRCTGGRRAAPPEDCGGIWRYNGLEEILADPEHPEHADMVEWLGLDDPADFDPARFSAEQVNEALAVLR